MARRWRGGVLALRSRVRHLLLTATISVVVLRGARERWEGERLEERIRGRTRERGVAAAAGPKCGGVCVLEGGGEGGERTLWSKPWRVASENDQHSSRIESTHRTTHTRLLPRYSHSQAFTRTSRTIRSANGQCRSSTPRTICTHLLAPDGVAYYRCIVLLPIPPHLLEYCYSTSSMIYGCVRVLLLKYAVRVCAYTRVCCTGSQTP